MLNDDLLCPSALELINSKELEETVLKFGSLMSMMTNKPLSCVSFFVLILKHPELKNALLQISDAEWIDIVKFMAYRYPVLNKSKKIQ